MKVADVMTREIVTFKESDTLSLVNDLMTLGQIRHFPVVDEAGCPVGMLSQRDLFRAALSDRLGLGPRAQRDFLESLTVRDEMVKPLVTAAPDEDLTAAVERMIENKVGALVVVQNGKLAGLLTESDLLRVLGEMLK